MTPAPRQIIAMLNPQWHEYFAERAAILEFDCKFQRDEAEELAWRETAAVMMNAKVGRMAQHQREHAKSRPLHAPRHEPILDRKAIAAGDTL